MSLSIIIPVFNEAVLVEPRLRALQYLRKQGVEIILVDGGSDDATVKIAAPLVDQLLASQPGRGVQMNLGAAAAKGEYLLFLHIDTQLPDNFLEGYTQWLTEHPGWGFFRVRLSGAARLLRMVEWMMNKRSQFTRVATGDQALLVRNQLFHRLGGYNAEPLMEDIALCKTLRRIASPVMVPGLVITSSRRWEEKGIFATILTMWWLRLLYFAGVSPARLVQIYYPNRRASP